MKIIKYNFEYCCSPLWLKDSDNKNSIFEEILSIDELIEIVSLFKNKSIAEKSLIALQKVKSQWLYSPIYSTENGFALPLREIQYLIIPTSLRKEIAEINSIYQSTYNQKDGRESGFKDSLQEGIWAYRAIHSAEILSFELKGAYVVQYNRKNWEYLVEKMYSSFQK